MFFRNKKRFLAMLLVTAVASSVCKIAACQVISAKTKDEEKSCSTAAFTENEEGTGSIQLAVVNADGEISLSPVSCYSATMSGKVYGDGVRLRKAPSLTSTVLELMDKGEVVSINFDKSQLSKGYYYVKRIKTGTRGYASVKYVSYI